MFILKKPWLCILSVLPLGYTPIHMAHIGSNVGVAQTYFLNNASLTRGGKDDEQIVLNTVSVPGATLIYAVTNSSYDCLGRSSVYILC